MLLHQFQSWRPTWGACDGSDEAATIPSTTPNYGAGPTEAWVAISRRGRCFVHTEGSEGNDGSAGTTSCDGSAPGKIVFFVNAVGVSSWLLPLDPQNSPEKIRPQRKNFITGT